MHKYYIITEDGNLYYLKGEITNDHWNAWKDGYIDIIRVKDNIIEVRNDDKWVKPEQDKFNWDF